MKNTFINQYRRNYRRQIAFDPTEDMFLLKQHKDTLNVEPDPVLHKKELDNVIDGLETAFRVPFRMHIDGYKYPEADTF